MGDFLWGVWTLGDTDAFRGDLRMGDTKIGDILCDCVRCVDVVRGKSVGSKRRLLDGAKSSSSQSSTTFEESMRAGRFCVGICGAGVFACGFRRRFMTSLYSEAAFFAIGDLCGLSSESSEPIRRRLVGVMERKPLSFRRDEDVEEPDDVEAREEAFFLEVKLPVFDKLDRILSRRLLNMVSSASFSRFPTRHWVKMSNGDSPESVRIVGFAPRSRRISMISRFPLEQAS